MIEVEADIKLDQAFLARLKEAERYAVERTAYALLDDLKLSGTMPLDTGFLQNDSTFVEVKDFVFRIISSTPYARRLYFNPQFNFRTDKNPLAGGRWFDPYLPGHAKGDFIPKTFAHFLKEKLGG